MLIVSGQVKRTISAGAMSASCTIVVADLSGQTCAMSWRGRSSISISPLPTADGGLRLLYSKCDVWTLHSHCSQGVIEDYFGAEFSETHIPVFNASPGQHLPIVLSSAPGKIQRALWGIKPEWMDRPSRLLINARAETVNQRPTFTESFRQRRCLVIADGFYEWKATKEGKQPYRIVLKTGEPFAFAGIWQEVAGERAYVILTTDANKVTQPIHDRMPVILERGERVLWLDQELPAEAGLKLLSPYPDDAMTAYRVSRAVNDSRNEREDVIEPLA